jgi:membrane-bound lytic murein transglycosylase B
VSAVVGILVALATAIGGGLTTGGTSPPALLPTAVPADRAQLQVDLDLAERIIDSRSSSDAELSSAGQFEQLATEVLARRSPATQRAVVAGLSPATAAATRTNLDAAGALSRLVTPRRSLPPWRIIQPPSPGTLRRFFEAAEARFGVPWQYLAAIEFVETKFGRVEGLSTAGAEGPMQFLPSTWARYGRGNVHDQRDAIMGAARFLVAAGARRNLSGALYHYNPSSDYVRAIADYAARMRADPRAYGSYYWWQVIYDRRGKPLVLPVGYPRVRPLAVTLP